MLHGEEIMVFADAGYQGAIKWPEATGVDWHVAMRPGKRRALNKDSPWGSLLDKAEQLKASVRAKGARPCQVIKCQFYFIKGGLTLDENQQSWPQMLLMRCWRRRVMRWLPWPTIRASKGLVCR